MPTYNFPFAPTPNGRDTTPPNHPSLNFPETQHHPDPQAHHNTHPPPPANNTTDLLLNTFSSDQLSKLINEATIDEIKDLLAFPDPYNKILLDIWLHMDEFSLHPPDAISDNEATPDSDKPDLGPIFTLPAFLFEEADVDAANEDGDPNVKASYPKNSGTDDTDNDDYAETSQASCDTKIMPSSDKDSDSYSSDDSFTE